MTHRGMGQLYNIATLDANNYMSRPTSKEPIMFPTRCLFLPFAFFLAVSINAQEPDLKGIIRKAIDAHGGEEKLAKMKGASSKFKGTLIVNGMTLDVTGESVAKLPDKFRNTLNLNINGMAIETAQIFDGKRYWVAAAGNTQELKDEKIIKEVREQIEAAADLGIHEWLLWNPACRYTRGALHPFPAGLNPMTAPVTVTKDKDEKGPAR